jgi:hypothetical protein
LASLRDNEQATALHYAALAGNEFACRELLLQGAQSSALAVRAFEQRQTPEELAEAYGHPHLASFLHRWKKQSNGVWKSAAQPQATHTFLDLRRDARLRMDVVEGSLAFAMAFALSCVPDPVVFVLAEA